MIYDAWGNVTYDYNEELDSLGMLEAMIVASMNSIMYRGYFYDFETGLYYLQSRYYDPETGRFINADDTAYIGYDSSPLTTNIFAYCANNPVSKVDYGGYSGKYIFEESISLFEPKREKDDYVFINRKKTPYYKALKNLAYTGSSVLSLKYPNGVKFYKRCLDGEGEMFMYNYMEAYNQDSQIKETIIKHFFEMKKYVIKYYGTKSNYSICRDIYFMVDCSTMDWKFALNSHWANIGAQIFYDSKAKEYTAKVAVLAIDLYNFSKTKAFKITDNAIMNKGVKFAIKNTGIFIEMGLAHDYYSYGIVAFKLKWKNDNRITVSYY